MNEFLSDFLREEDDSSEDLTLPIELNEKELDLLTGALYTEIEHQKERGPVTPMVNKEVIEPLEALYSKISEAKRSLR